MHAPLFDKSNRGLLLDVAVLAANLLAMPPLSRAFLGLVQRAGGEDAGAMAVLFGYSIALFVLAPAGATLKRWHYHQRRGNTHTDFLDGAGGCLFNPIFYFCLAVVIFSTINAFILQGISGGREPDGTLFISSIFLGLGLIILHTWLVYRYFSPPRNPPRSAFLRSRTAEVLGDTFLFLNMLLFQLIWNMFSFAGLGGPSGIVEAIARLLMLLFLALLLYFPPRMFYLVEDIDKPRTWLMILLANAPVIFRMTVGSGGS